MSYIALTESALDALARDPEFARWKQGKTTGEVPLLHYYRRSYSTLRDGTIVEHGDGFSLTFVDPDEVKDAKHVAYEKVALAGGGFIFVGATKSLLASDFSIGWSDGKFAREPQASRSPSPS